MHKYQYILNKKNQQQEKLFFYEKSMIISYAVSQVNLSYVMLTRKQKKNELPPVIDFSCVRLLCQIMHRQFSYRTFWINEPFSCAHPLSHAVRQTFPSIQSVLNRICFRWLFSGLHIIKVVRIKWKAWKVKFYFNNKSKLKVAKQI